MEQPSPLPTEELRKIYEECGGDPRKLADRLGLSLPQGAAGRVVPPLVPYYRRRVPPNDLGKTSMRKYIVSIRHAEIGTWPKDDQPKIDDARSKYEAGTHEMCQGRDRDYFILYCIPRKQRVGARKFFRVFGE